MVEDILHDSPQGTLETHPVPEDIVEPQGRPIRRGGGYKRHPGGNGKYVGRVPPKIMQRS